MSAKTAADVRGLEFDWLATDAEGHVGFFSTAGEGFAPEDFLADTDAHDKAIDALLELGASTQSVGAPGLGPDCVNTWQMMAERGIYAFDADPGGGPYRIAASPAAPVRI